VISEKALEEFIKLYKEEFGVELDNKTAIAVAINLLTFFDNIYKPIKKEWLEE
jgi:hypothetical protein